MRAAVPGSSANSSWPGPVGPGEGRGEPLADLIVVCDGLILGAPVRAAEPRLDAPTRGRVEEEERDLMSVFVLNDPPGVLRAEAGIGEHLLVQKDLSWRGAGAPAVEDADRDLLVNEIPVEATGIERRAHCSLGSVAPAGEDVMAAGSPGATRQDHGGQKSDPGR
jgi:hypothetical protein